MKKLVSIVLFAALLVGSLVSCGSSKHAGKCDAYSLKKQVITTSQDLAGK
jgi:hypothetical protein